MDDSETGDRGSWRSPRGGRGSWNSPRFQGNYRNFSPRYSGGGRWQQRNPSPYDNPHFRNQSPYSSPSGHFLTSNPPAHYNQRPRFNRGSGPRFDKSHAEGSIEAWISPAMWEDPWRHLIQNSNLSKTLFDQMDSDLNSIDDVDQSISDTSQLDLSSIPSKSNLLSESTTTPALLISSSINCETSAENPTTNPNELSTPVDLTESAKDILNLISS